MPERLEKLRAALSDLQQELQGLDEVDVELRDRLEAARLEIEQTLDQSEPPGQWQPQTLIERLQDNEAHFEATHPTLAGIVRRTIDILAQMGI